MKSPIIQASQRAEALTQRMKKTSEGSQEKLPDELAIDTSWDDIYDLAPSPGLNQSTETATPDPGSINSAKQTLHNHLMWQMELTNFLIPTVPLPPPLSTALIITVI